MAAGDGDHCLAGGDGGDLAGRVDRRDGLIAAGVGDGVRRVCRGGADGQVVSVAYFMEGDGVAGEIQPRTGDVTVLCWRANQKFIRDKRAEDQQQNRKQHRNGDLPARLRVRLRLGGLLLFLLLLFSSRGGRLKLCRRKDLGLVQVCLVGGIAQGADIAIFVEYCPADLANSFFRHTYAPRSLPPFAAGNAPRTQHIRTARGEIFYLSYHFFRQKTTQGLLFFQK